MLVVKRYTVGPCVTVWRYQKATAADIFHETINGWMIWNLNKQIYECYARICFFILLFTFIQ